MDKVESAFIIYQQLLQKKGVGDPDLFIELFNEMTDKEKEKLRELMAFERMTRKATIK